MTDDPEKTQIDADISVDLPIQKSLILKPLGAILAAFGLFLVPQVIVGIGLVASGIISLDDPELGGGIGQTFAIFGSAELITVGMLLLILRVSKEKLSRFGVVKKGLENVWMVLPAFGFYFILTTAIGVAATFVLSEDILNAEQDVGFGDASQDWELILAFVALVVVAPFVEELLFRGYLFRKLRDHWPFWAAALVSSLLFGLAHMQINVAMDTFALAMVLAYLVEKTHNLWIAVGLHAAKNMLAFTFLFLIDTDALTALL